MDNNTFALFVLGFGTVIVAVVVWQIFATARARMTTSAADAPEALRTRMAEGQARLDARLRALADDVQAVERRVSALEDGGSP